MKKHTQKTLLLSITALIVCVALLAGTTLAWFTDSVSSGVNTIKAGNLDIEVYHTNAKVTTEEKIDGRTDLFTDKNGNPMNWEPGAVAYETFTVNNEGSLALKYNLKLNITDYNAVQGTNYTLKDVLKVKVLEGNRVNPNITRENVANLGWSNADPTLYTFQKDGGVLMPKGTDPDSEEFQVVVYWLPREDDNNWNVNNGKTTTDGKDHLFINFGINVAATQKDQENDSFGNDYDVTAPIPGLPANISKTFTSAANTQHTISDAITIQNPNPSTEASNVTATVPQTSAQQIVDNLKTQAGITDNTSISTVFNLEVTTDNTTRTDTSVTYNINLSAVMEYVGTNGTKQTETLNNVNGLSLTDPVKATLDIGKGLKDVSVKHDGTPMVAVAADNTAAEGFYYDKTTGKLTIWTKSFSPFAVAYQYDGEAVSGNTLYATLGDAIAAAKNGDTITLLKDVEATVSENAKVAFTLDKNVTLNGNGRTITVTGDSSADTFAIRSTNSGAITNLKLNVTGVERAIRLDGNGTYSVSSTTVTGTGVGIHVKGAAEVSLKEVDVTINPADAFQAHKRTGIMVGAAADVTITDSNVTVNASGKTDDTLTWGKGLYVGTNAKGHIVVNNTNVNADFAIAIDGSSDQGNLNSITINSGTFTGKAGSPSGYSYKQVIINGGTFNDFGFAANTFYDTTNPIARMIISGGTFSADPSAYVATGYEASLKDDGLYHIETIVYWKDHAAESYATPVDTENKVVTIASAEELALFANQVNDGNKYAGYTVKLTNNIDLAGKRWTPIGNLVSYPTITFSGTFDGQGYTIANMRASDNTVNHAAAGFFGSTAGATIKNVTFKKATVNSTHYAGVVVAYEGANNSITTITNVVVDGAKVVSSAEMINGTWDNGDKVGGIAGYATSTAISNCTVKNSTIQGYRDLGGIIGCAEGEYNASVSGCTVDTVTISVDKTHNYKNYTARDQHNVNNYIGRNLNNAADSDNSGTVTINY